MINETVDKMWIKFRLLAFWTDVFFNLSNILAMLQNVKHRCFKTGSKNL